MTSADLLSDAFGRVRGIVEEVLDGLSRAELSSRLDGEANSIAWLLWHLARVEDDHVAHVAGTEQAWTASGWAERFALPLEVSDIGYGHRPEQAALVTADADVLGGYYGAVHENTLRFVRHVSDADLNRVVDERWDPPVTLGVRLVSVLADDLQHAGQAAYVRGILQRRR
ncbi:MAG: mycothiol transferase [Acidimicrobiales bacterium]